MLQQSTQGTFLSVPSDIRLKSDFQENSDGNIRKTEKNGTVLRFSAGSNSTEDETVVAFSSANGTFNSDEMVSSVPDSRVLLDLLDTTEQLDQERCPRNSTESSHSRRGHRVKRPDYLGDFVCSVTIDRFRL